MENLIKGHTIKIIKPIGDEKYHHLTCLSCDLDVWCMDFDSAKVISRIHGFLISAKGSQLVFDYKNIIPQHEEDIMLEMEV